MDERAKSDLAVFPLVRYAQGGPAPDGSALLVEGATAEGEPVRFALSLADVQNFVAFLLISVGQIGVMRGDPTPIPDETIAQSPAVAATSIAVGQPANNEGYLGPSWSFRSRYPPSTSSVAPCWQSAPSLPGGMRRERQDE